ncbi:hypothetical protein TOTORO_02090 [Serratia phage vB_SmaS-Totoro]|nr:hypothetical protein TOTORO_02090 [Serratia phage vB_SmaS-Totoro]
MGNLSGIVRYLNVLPTFLQILLTETTHSGILENREEGFTPPRQSIT